MIPALRVFISSTFLDLEAERETLAKKVFPEVRAVCRARGVEFTEIDLRWGVTRAATETLGVVGVCLEEIDRCRPFFIGILGARYGWIPSEEERVDGRRSRIRREGVQRSCARALRTGASV